VCNSCGHCARGLATPALMPSLFLARVGESGDDTDLEALKAGDEAAFRALIKRHHGPMLRLAMAYVRDAGVAEEVVQETWLTCLRSLDKFEGRSSLKTWIFGIAMNVARARRRKEARILPFASLWRRDDSDGGRPTVDRNRFGSDGLWSAPPDSWSNLPETNVLGIETLQRVKQAIQSLPMKQREVITLRDVAGLDADEVCGLLSITAENQRVRLHRARAAVRRMLEEYLQ
jgi:RNA polymerase sigma-70 factor, ECF subfamily